MELMGTMQSLMSAMQQANQPPPPIQTPPPPPPLSPATKEVMARPGALSLDALMAELMRRRQQGG
jgi:hypothetical protein